MEVRGLGHELHGVNIAHTKACVFRHVCPHAWILLCLAFVVGGRLGVRVCIFTMYSGNAVGMRGDTSRLRFAAVLAFPALFRETSCLCVDDDGAFYFFSRTFTFSLAVGNTIYIGYMIYIYLYAYPIDRSHVRQVGKMVTQDQLAERLGNKPSSISTPQQQRTPSRLVTSSRGPVSYHQQSSATSRYTRRHSVWFSSFCCVLILIPPRYVLVCTILFLFFPTARVSFPSSSALLWG